MNHDTFTEPDALAEGHVGEKTAAFAKAATRFQHRARPQGAGISYFAMLTDHDVGADADFFADAAGVSNYGRGVDAWRCRRPVVEQVCQPGVSKVWVSGDQAIDRARLCIFFPQDDGAGPGCRQLVFVCAVGQESDLRWSGFFQS